MITKPHSTPSFFSSLSDMLNQSHPLSKLADKIGLPPYNSNGKRYRNHKGKLCESKIWVSPKTQLQAYTIRHIIS